MKDFTDILCPRTTFGRGMVIFIGAIASVYIAKEGIQYVKKLSNKRRNSFNQASATTSSQLVETTTANTTPTKSSTAVICSICHKKFNTAIDAGNSSIDNIVNCGICSTRTCENPKCAIWSTNQNQWECTECHQFNSIVHMQAYDWIFERLNRKCDDKAHKFNAKLLESDGTNNRKEIGDVMLKLNDESAPIPLQEKVRIREFIEDLIESMLGGTLDNVCVEQIFKNFEYLPVSEHDSPDTSYANLRKIIRAVIQEVIKLPEFYNQKEVSGVDSNQVRTAFEPKIYEDLLATAVINKIVETYNDKKYENSSGIHSGGSDLDSNCNNERSNFGINSRCSSTEPEVGHDQFQSRSMKTADIIDEIFREKLGREHNRLLKSSPPLASARIDEHSDYKQIRNISLPDFDVDVNSSTDSEDIEQEFQSIYTLATSTELDQNHIDLSDNWSFRKNNLRPYPNGQTSSAISASSSSVSMLVPSPTEECRTLIGDRHVDEISDLSEVGSDLDSTNAGDDDDDEDNVNGFKGSACDLPHVLVESKTLIGGKNEVKSFDHNKDTLIDLLEPGSLVSETSLTGNSAAISEAKNNLILIDDSTEKIDVMQIKRLEPMNLMESNDKIMESVEIDQNALIDFESFDIASENSGCLINKESNDVEIVTKMKINLLDYEPIPAPRTHNESKRVTGSNAKQAGDFTDDFNDSLEGESTPVRVVSTNPLESTDLIEQDSLESNEKASFTPSTSPPISSLIPLIAQLEKTLCKANASAQNSSCAHSDSINQNVAIESQCNTIESIHIDFNNRTNSVSLHEINTNQPSKDNEYDVKDLPGSIAEREHMKWQNAIELPNNPYSSEALQRRLIQTSCNKSDIERLTTKCEANRQHVEQNAIANNNNLGMEKPIKVVVGAGKLDQVRYGRDYYINDAKAASGSKTKKTCASLNYHRSIEDTEDDAADDNDSLLVGNIEVVSTKQLVAKTDKSFDLLLKTQPIQVDENDSILEKATKLDQLCTDDRDYYLLQSDATTSDEYAKISLSSETYDSSYAQGDDSLSTTVSEESDGAATVRVYDLNTRETKILRHDIIKRSRNPVGDLFTAENDIDDNSSNLKSAKTHSPLHSTIKVFDSRILENANETRKPPISPTKLKSVHLNRNPRKFKMDDVQLVDDASETSLKPQVVDDKLSCEITSTESVIITEEILKTNEIVQIGDNLKLLTIETENLLESERNNNNMECLSEVAIDSETKEISDNAENQIQSIASVEISELNAAEKENNGAAHLIDEHEVDETVELSTTESHGQYGTAAPLQVIIEDQTTIEEQPKFERQPAEIVVVNGHVEKPVIEEDVISVLPSVKALAKSFLTQKDANLSPSALYRSKIVQHRSFDGCNYSDIDDDMENPNVNENKPSRDSFIPHFNHAYHPVAPGHSITARSLSTKFREELRNSTQDNIGRSSPERPLSPVLVPGILKNNVAFFENLKNK